MPNYLVENNFSQSTADLLTPIIAEDQIEARAVFSISASNDLQGTIWLVKNGQVVLTDLGPAKYEIFDKDGVSLGVSESGLTADLNGQYQITPTSAVMIQDLTHYVVLIEVSYQSSLRKNYIGITLGE